MGTVFVDMVMSLDGFIAGPNNDDSGLHDYSFAPSGQAVGVIDELLSIIGAMIIGRHSFGDRPFSHVVPGLHRCPPQMPENTVHRLRNREIGAVEPVANARRLTV
jgi:hypothetical protein